MSEWRDAREKMSAKGFAVVGRTSGKVWGFGLNEPAAMANARGNASRQGFGEKVKYAALWQEVPNYNTIEEIFFV